MAWGTGPGDPTCWALLVQVFQVGDGGLSAAQLLSPIPQNGPPGLSLRVMVPYLGRP